MKFNALSSKSSHLAYERQLTDSFRNYESIMSGQKSILSKSKFSSLIASSFSFCSLFSVASFAESSSILSPIPCSCFSSFFSITLSRHEDFVNLLNPS